jgi:hypothetical protein
VPSLGNHAENLGTNTMTRLDVSTLEHLSKWCNCQFNDNHIATFNSIVSFLESLEPDEQNSYLSNSTWHAYDVAKQLGFMHD